MQDIKFYFKENEWKLIQDILKNGKNNSWCELADKYGIRQDSNSDQKKKAANDIYRKYLRKMNTPVDQPKILIYDIETSRVQADLWWSGKQYVNGSQITSEPSIITLAWKWFGSDEVYHLKWDKKKSDKKLVTDFLKEYNKADMVIGYNNDNFDNRWINARALRYGLDVNVHVKSFDIMKQSKRLFRLPSYSMNYLAKFVGVETKLQHTGLAMWEAIQNGGKREAKKAMKLMIEYNVQDIIVTEQVFLKVVKYMKFPIHLGVIGGKSKASCPSCGSENVKLHKTSVTAAGTIQRIMKCKEDKHTYKISNSTYLKEFAK